MNEELRQLFLDIQYWMMAFDYDKETPEGAALFNRISKLTGVNWDALLKEPDKHAV